jgi:hypothetical protein
LFVCRQPAAMLFSACSLPVRSIWAKSTRGRRLPHDRSPNRLSGRLLHVLGERATRIPATFATDLEKVEEGLEMTITVLLMTLLTGANHTVAAEYDTPQACEAAARAHQKVLLENSISSVFSCSPKAAR